MSTNATAIFGQLRGIIQSKRLNLTHLSEETKIPYHRLWKFLKKGRPLSLEEAESLHVELVGKTFISTTDVA